MVMYKYIVLLPTKLCLLIVLTLWRHIIVMFSIIVYVIQSIMFTKKNDKLENDLDYDDVKIHH